MFIENLKLNKGFTLVELMVATTLFTIIMLIGIGSLVTASNSSRQAQKLRTAVDNVNFAMESMSRELRTGTYYNCGDNSVDYISIISNDCPNGGNAIAFTPQQTNGAPSRVAYVLQSNKIQRCTSSNHTCTPIVSDDVSINKINFVVNGSNINDNIQPSVKIFISGTVNVKDSPSYFILQTIASQRSSEK